MGIVVGWTFWLTLHFFVIRRGQRAVFYQSVLSPFLLSPYLYFLNVFWSILATRFAHYGLLCTLNVLSYMHAIYALGVKGQWPFCSKTKNLAIKFGSHGAPFVRASAFIFWHVRTLSWTRPFSMRTARAILSSCYTTTCKTRTLHDIREVLH
jgi:hypothetical protein